MKKNEKVEITKADERIRRLLSLKRYETPSEGASVRIAAGVARRIREGAVAPASQPLWSPKRALEWFSLPQGLHPAWVGAAAALVLIAVGGLLMLPGMREGAPASIAERPIPEPRTFVADQTLPERPAAGVTAASNRPSNGVQYGTRPSQTVGFEE